MILESAFTNAKDMASEMFPLPLVQFVIRSRFDSVNKIRQIHAPLLSIHGSMDSIVPIELGRKLFEAANDPKWFYEISGADHNDTYWVGGEEYFRRIGEFLGRLQDKHPQG